jgi:GT2 family glycosyltransferase
MFLGMSTARNARTAVVVLYEGHADDTAACVEALERSEDLDIDVDLVVVDADTGRCDALNEGITRALDHGCDLVWLLRADAVVASSTLPRLREHLDAVRDCGIVGPRILLAEPAETIWFDGGIVDPETGAVSHLNLGRKAHAVLPARIDVDFVSGSSMLVRRSMIEDIGLLPARDLHFFEVAAWCASASSAGWRVMVDQRATVVRRTTFPGLTA